VHRAGLADERATELPEHPLDLQQLSPEQPRRAAVVGVVRLVLGERNGVLHLVRHRVDLHLDAELAQRGHDLGVERGNRLRRQHDRA
jgi:hypothetical protein